VELHNQQLFRQNRFPDNNFDTDVVEDGKFVTKTVDVSTPPAGYNKIGADLNWGPYPAFSGKINISLSFDNLLNTSYRNYLNRLRFYADEHGRNVMLQIKFNH
jgi:iron complex outermembrane receptor protein